MRERKYLVLSLILVFLCTWSVLRAEDREECPKTGTSFDPLITEAYDCQGKFLDADISVSHGVTTLKELYNTLLEKTEEESQEVLDMLDSAFTALISGDEVRLELVEKLTADSKATLDTLTSQLEESVEGLNEALVSAKDVVQKIPGAITSLPKELKGLKAMKIPKVKSALEKAKEWMDDVIAKAPVDVETAASVVDIVKGLIGGE